jgi:hypothetical protein
MIKKILLLLVIISIFFYIHKKSSIEPTPTPSSTPSAAEKDEIIKKALERMKTPAPTDDFGNLIRNFSSTTKFPLTDLAIRATFTPSSDFKQVNIESFINLLNTKLSKEIIKKLIGTQSFVITSENVFTFLDCYVLYTNVFTHPYDKNAGDVYSDEYDIIGAYFIFQLPKYASSSPGLFKNGCQYIQSIFSLILPKELLKNAVTAIGKSFLPGEDGFFVAGVVMPISLDDFVPRISKYLYNNFANNRQTSQLYYDMLQKCKN